MSDGLIPNSFTLHRPHHGTEEAKEETKQEKKWGYKRVRHNYGELAEKCTVTTLAEQIYIHTKTTGDCGGNKGIAIILDCTRSIGLWRIKTLSKSLVINTSPPVGVA